MSSCATLFSFTHSSTSRDEAIEPEPEFDALGNVIEKAQSEQNDVVAEKDELQTFVFSATLSKDLQRNLKKRIRPNGKNRKPASTLGTAFRGVSLCSCSQFCR